MLDVIADPEAQGELHLVLSKPYYRSGVALVVPQNSQIKSFVTLDGHTKVAVQVGSIVSMILGQRHVGLSTYAFEDEMLQAVADGEADAAAVTPVSAGYFNLAHPDHKLTILPSRRGRSAAGLEHRHRYAQAGPTSARGDGQSDRQIQRRWNDRRNLRPLRRDVAATEVVSAALLSAAAPCIS